MSADQELPILAWSYVPSDVWADVVLTADADKAQLAREYGREVTSLADHAQATARIEDLKRRLETAEKDAARYRWLRRQPNNTKAPRIDVVRWTKLDRSANEGEGLRLDELDAAIDASLNTKEPTHG